VDAGWFTPQCLYTNFRRAAIDSGFRRPMKTAFWNETGAEVAFAIKPRFYRTLWFSGLATLLLVALSLPIYRMRVRAIRSRSTRYSRNATAFAREIHDTLAQGFVGVSVQLELTAHLLAQSRVDEASQQVDRTRDLVGRTCRRSSQHMGLASSGHHRPHCQCAYASREQSGTGHLKTT